MSTRVKQSGVAAIGFAVTLLMLWLGLWQMRVFEATEAESAQARLGLPAVDLLAEVAPDGNLTGDVYGRRVRVSGHYLPELSVLVQGSGTDGPSTGGDGLDRQTGPGDRITAGGKVGLGGDGELDDSELGGDGELAGDSGPAGDAQPKVADGTDSGTCTGTDGGSDADTAAGPAVGPDAGTDAGDASDACVRVLTGFETTDGRLLPVVRGMVSASEQPPPPPEGPVELTGVFLPSEQAADPPNPTGLGSVRLATLAQFWPDQQLLPGFLTLDAELADAEGLAADIPEVPGGQGSWQNLGYALQWWVFAGFAAFLTVRFLRTLGKPRTLGAQEELSAVRGAADSSGPTTLPPIGLTSGRWSSERTDGPATHP